MIYNNEKDLYDMYGQYTENRQSTYKAQHQIRTSQTAADTATMSLDWAKIRVELHIKESWSTLKYSHALNLRKQPILKSIKEIFWLIVQTEKIALTSPWRLYSFRNFSV